MSENLSISPDFVDFMVGSGGSGFWGGNPLANPKGSGSVGGDPPPTIELVGSGGGGSSSGGFGGLGGWTGSMDTPTLCCGLVVVVVLVVVVAVADGRSGCGWCCVCFFG